MSRMADSRTLVVGVGNDFRGDDAAGLEVARMLAARALPVDVRESDGDVAELIDLWNGYETVIVVDAVVSGSAPGRVIHFDARLEVVPSVFAPHVSSHGNGLAEAIELAGALDQLPPELHVYGIEAQTFAIGDAISAPVQCVLEGLVDEIARFVAITATTTRQGVN